jgi:hypothetical protein
MTVRCGKKNAGSAAALQRAGRLSNQTGWYVVLRRRSDYAFRSSSISGSLGIR